MKILFCLLFGHRPVRIFSLGCFGSGGIYCERCTRLLKRPKLEDFGFNYLPRDDTKP